MAYCYVLQCTGDDQYESYFYVGFTKYLEQRLFTHFVEPAVKWLLLHPPAEILYAVHCDNESTERHETLRLMEEYGHDRVRGYKWTQPVPIKRPKALTRFFADEDPPDYVSDWWLREIKRRIDCWMVGSDIIRPCD